MNQIGQAEALTQARILRLFEEELGYEPLGNLRYQNNRNIKEGLLEAFLHEQEAYSPALIRRAITELQRVAANSSLSLYDRNRAVYSLLRYGVPVKAEVGALTETVWLIDWKNPVRNHFAIAEEVTVPAADPRVQSKRPDLVLYVNGIALGVLELKRSRVSVGEGIRQNLDNQKKEFIEPFFSTIQFTMAGNDSQGLRYGTIGTTEKHYLTWKEEAATPPAPPFDGPLDQGLRQICSKERFLELIHDFVVFDGGIKKLCRHNQYFGVRAAQAFVKRRDGGILWHTQGSGKSLTMVWLAKWIRENVRDARVLIITDRTELDEQIEKVFLGVSEQILRMRKGAELIEKLNAPSPWLLCSLVHKFGGKTDSKSDTEAFLKELREALPKGFAAKGNLFVFVDECHRSQSGELHQAMKAILPEATFLGFTGTPLLKSDKKQSIEIFGPYIHTYKFDEAVRDGVVLDLRYEARNIDTYVSSPEKIDQWFEAKTRGLSDLAKAQLRQRWGTMQAVSSSRRRLQQICNDILLDMETKERLQNGRGNAMLVAGSIYEACKFYELFASTPLKGKCAIVTSYEPALGDIQGQDSGEGANEAIEKYETYQKMLADWFDEPAKQAIQKAALFEKQVKEKFVHEPAQMKLLIVVDKLLTGFDAPSATYLYIDKQMRDHGLFQAICRVNRLDGEDKEYGYIVDYQDLFRNLEGAVLDYTSGAFDGFDAADVAGLLEDRLEKGRERLEEILEQLHALCEPVEPPRDARAFYSYFAGEEAGDLEILKAKEPQRLSLYRLCASLIRAFADIANELPEAGYSATEAASLKEKVRFYTELRDQVKRYSGDDIDLKQYEPAMRHLIDTYIGARDSQTISSFEDFSLVQLIVEQGSKALEKLPEAIRSDEKLSAETIENNVRKLIIDESPINPKYYERMSELLDALVAQRQAEALDYQAYLAEIIALAKQVQAGPSAGAYPPGIDKPGRRALYDNLGRDAELALRVDNAVRESLQDDWRNSVLRRRRVLFAIQSVIGGGSERAAEASRILDLVREQDDY